jgi:hypothetical protein
MKTKKFILCLMAMLTLSTTQAAITKEEFDGAIQEMRDLFTEKVAVSSNAKLVIDGRWEDSTINSYTQKFGEKFIMVIFGGIARHEYMTKDAMKLVACAELGHVLGGNPRNTWSTLVGQADYYATSKCLKIAFKNDDNIAIVKKINVPVTVSVKCGDAFESREQKALCIRSALAGISLANLLSSLNPQSPKVSIDTPSKEVASQTKPYHPDVQCRLDTYVAGAQCDSNLNDDHDQDFGFCETGTPAGRPLCWFNPAN